MEALIIVDIQNDFLPGGALAVPQGNEITGLVNQLIPMFDLTVATQDWHPADHSSFSSNHLGTKPGEIIKLHDLDQILWPDHCIQHTYGSEFDRNMNTEGISQVFRKGTDPTIDSYSGFFDNGHLKSTGMGDFLQAKGVNAVTVVGLATDYCVKFTALDAVELGFTTTVLADATRAVNLRPGDDDLALQEMEDCGVQIAQSAKILK